MTDKITFINRNIADGENFSHTGSVELQGNIGKGAVVDIKKGGLLVKGSVGDDASITAKGGSSGGSISVSGNSVVISGSISGVTIVNGRVISGGGDQSGGGLSGITVEQTTGSGVVLDTDGAIELKDSAGDRLRAKADGSLSLQDVGPGLKANAGGGFHGDNIGPYARISAGGSLHIEELGAESVANGGGSAHVEKVGTGCTLNAGGSARIESVGRDSTVNAGGSVRVTTAHTEASIMAGGSKKIGRLSSDDADFELTQVFRQSATPAAKAPDAEPPAPGGPKKGFSL